MTGRFAFLAIVAGLGVVTGLAAGRSQGSDNLRADGGAQVFQVSVIGAEEQRVARAAPEILVPHAALVAASEAAARAASQPRPVADIQLASAVDRVCAALPGGSATDEGAPVRRALPQAHAGLQDPCGADALAPEPDRLIVE